jgi:hypothetical protein
VIPETPDTTEGVLPVAVAPASTVTVYQKKVMIVLPWQKLVSPITSFSVAQLMDRRRTSSMLNFGDAFVTHSRNTCADVFLSSPCDWMLTIDDDMVIPFGSSRWFRAHTQFDFAEKFLEMNALDRLMSHGKTLVGALYFGRHRFGPPVYNEGTMSPQEANYARSGPHDLIKPTRWVGTGCMLIHRSVYEDIERTFPRLARGADKKGGQWFTSTEASLMEQVKRLRDGLQDGTPLTGEKAYKALEGLESVLAMANHENSLGVGEDVSFCLRAKAAGHTPYVDMGLICGHLGHACYGPRNTTTKPPTLNAA